MMRYAVNTNEPGYMPVGEGHEYESFDDAFDALWNELGQTLANDPEYTLGDRYRFHDAVHEELASYGLVDIPVGDWNHFIAIV